MPTPDSPVARTQKGFLTAGYIILIAGLLGAGWAYRSANVANDAATRQLISDTQNSKAYEYNLEVQGGKANVAVTNFGIWFAGLWQGRRLATTLAVLAVTLALGCFLIAYFLPSLPPFPPPHDSPG